MDIVCEPAFRHTGGVSVEEEAAAVVRGSPEAMGPHIIADRADSLADAMIPETVLFEQTYLTGRIALSIEETQLALGIGERTMRTAMRNGEIPSVKIGGRRLVPVKALERHLEALAYASSGALDAWENALVQAATTRMKTARRRRWERRKYLRRKLREARLAGLNSGEAGRDYFTGLRTELAELEREQAVTDRFRRDMEIEIDQAEDEYGLTEGAMEAPRLGLPE